MLQLAQRRRKYHSYQPIWMARQKQDGEQDCRDAPLAEKHVWLEHVCRQIIPTWWDNGKTLIDILLCVFWLILQFNAINSIARHPSPCRRYAQHLKDAQASECCSQALGKCHLTFPVCSAFHCMTVSTNRYHQHLTWVLFQHQTLIHRNMSQPRNPSWLYFPKLPYILQAYRHTCLQRNEAGERVSSRMVGIGKSVLFS